MAKAKKTLSLKEKKLIKYDNAYNAYLKLREENTTWKAKEAAFHIAGKFEISLTTMETIIRNKKSNGQVTAPI